MKRSLVVSLGMTLAASTLSAATFTVTNTNDSGAGSLRQAIDDANASPGLDTIAFNIPLAGIHTIAPATELPAVSDPVLLDGYTQPGTSQNTDPIGTNAVILIEIDGGVDVGHRDQRQRARGEREHRPGARRRRFHHGRAGAGGCGELRRPR